MSRYDVFLSHASADKLLVEHLAHKLREAGFEPFLDKWHLVPGQSWQEALEEALDQSRSCAVFIGRELGPWQNQEMRVALDSRVSDGSFLVIPVLLPGAKDPGTKKLPPFLRLLTWVDFRVGLDDEDAFKRLLAGIQGEAPGSGSMPALPYRCMAPAREHFVQRSEYGEVRSALLAEASGCGTTVGITTAILGAGGFGKTALALELCYDPQVRERYPDGILWTTMGEEIDDSGRLARVRDLIRWWTDEDPPAFETVSAASAHLRQELADRRVLLVVDDVWRPEDVTSFQGRGPNAALLVTTRDSRTLPAESIPVHVDAMAVPEAVRLLGAELPKGPDVDLQRLAARLGEWPLLLKIVNRQLRELIQKDRLSLELALREIEEALDEEGLTAFDREDLESRSQAVARTVGASLRLLSSDEVGRFEQLAIFPEDKDIPLRILEKLWESGSYAAKKFCHRLHDLSLLLRFDREAGTIRLHDVIRAYLLKKGENRLPEWNRHLLDAYRPSHGRWPDLPRNETYLWNHLFHHLAGAGQSDICRGLLLDIQYLRSKLESADINALLADYSSFVEKDQELRLVRDALQLSAHVLAKNPPELPGQLWGRLLDRQETEIRDLLRASTTSDAVWLLPRRASLNRPGGGLIRTIAHAARPEALAVLPSHRVISASYDGKLRVWDVESGQILRILEGPSRVNAVAVLDSNRVVSGENNGRLRVWDLESGQTLQILEGHSTPVNAVAVLDGYRVVSGSDDATLRVWNVETGQPLQTLVGHSRPVNAVVSLDHYRIMSGSYDGTLRLWNVDSGQALREFNGHSRSVNTVAILNNQQVVSGSDDATLRVWNMESGQTLQILEGHSASVVAAAVLDDKRVVSGSDDATLRVWNVETGQTLQILEGHSFVVNTVAMLDSHRVVSGSHDWTLRVWDVESRKVPLSISEGHSSSLLAMAVLDGSRVVSASADGKLRVWEESGQVLRTLEGHSDWVMAVAALDSQRVVSGSADKTLQVWDVESGRVQQVFQGHSAGILAVAAVDSSTVVSGSSDGTLRMWDVASGQSLQTPKEHTGWVHAVAVLDSRRVISGCRDGTLCVWDIQEGEILRILKGHSGGVRALAVLDRRRVVSGSDDRTLRVWDVESGHTLKVLEGHLNLILAVAVLDGRRVVSGSYGGTLRVWDIESGKGECLFTLDAPVTAVAVLAGGRVIVAGDGSGRVHFFDLVGT